MPVGQRVLLILPDPGPKRFGVIPNRSIHGDLMAFANESVFVRVHPRVGAVGVPKADIVALFVSQGPPSRWRSARKAIPWGFLLGAVIANGVFDADFRRPGCESRNEALLVGAIAGATVGGINGALFPKEHWKRLHR